MYLRYRRPLYPICNVCGPFAIPLVTPIFNPRITEPIVLDVPRGRCPGCRGEKFFAPTESFIAPKELIDIRNA